MLHSSRATPVHSIRKALTGEEQQIRVNDSTSRETYDLTLSASVPFASPVVSRSVTPSDGNARQEMQQRDQPETTPSGHLNTPPDSTATPAHLSSSSPANNGHRILKLPQLVSRRVNAVPVESPHAFARTTPKAELGPPLLPDSHFTAPPRHHPLVGELPPSPPPEPDSLEIDRDDHGAFSSPSSQALASPPQGAVPRRVHTMEEDAFLSGFGSNKPAWLDDRNVLSSSSNDQRRLEDGHGPAHGWSSSGDDRHTPSHVSRGGSRGVSESTSSAYATASSAAGEDEEEDPGSESGRKDHNRAQREVLEEARMGTSTAPATPAVYLTADPTSYLHPSSAAQEAGPSSLPNRTPAPSPPRQPLPPRRNTTGSALQSHRPRSSSSTATQQSGAGSTAYGAAKAGVLGGAPALKTGDVDFDEDIAKQAEQIWRKRMSKRAQEQQEREAGAGEGEVLQYIDGNAAAVARSKTGKDGKEKEFETDMKPLVGNLIGEDHVNYVLMYNMLTGIRIGVSRLILSVGPGRACMLIHMFPLIAGLALPSQDQTPADGCRLFGQAQVHVRHVSRTCGVPSASRDPWLTDLSRTALATS